jgi:hypothetical protein
MSGGFGEAAPFAEFAAALFLDHLGKTDPFMATSAEFVAPLLKESEDSLGRCLQSFVAGENQQVGIPYEEPFACEASAEGLVVLTTRDATWFALELLRQ